MFVGAEVTADIKADVETLMGCFGNVSQSVIVRTALCEYIERHKASRPKCIAHGMWALCERSNDYDSGNRLRRVLLIGSHEQCENARMQEIAIETGYTLRVENYEPQIHKAH